MSRRSHHWRIAGLVLLATIGGYAVTALASSVLALLLTRSGLSLRANAVMVTSLLSFTLYTAFVLRIFAVDSGKRASMECGVALVLLGAGFLALRLWP